jgi:hypothetical protein
MRHITERALKLLAVTTILFSTQQSATVIAEGSLNWSFDTPVNINYLYGDDSFGRIYDSSTSTTTRAYLDPTGFGRLELDESYVEGEFDALTGNSSAKLQSVDPDSGSFSSWSSVNFVMGFTAFTDIISFSYTYDFSGVKENENDWLNFWVQLKVNGNELYYTDYDPSHPTHRTKSPGDNRGPDLVKSSSGTFDFTFGEVGVFQNWSIQSDFLLNARDSAGSTSSVPEPSTFIIILLGISLLLSRHFKI